MTVTIAVLVSAVVSLTLTPMMCSRFLRHHKGKHGPLYRVIEAMFDGMLRFYERTLDVALRFQFITLMVFLATLATTVALFIVDPEGLLPAAGHRLRDRHRARAAGRVVRRDEPPQVAFGAVVLPGSRTSRACLLRRRRRWRADSAQFNAAHLLHRLKPKDAGRTGGARTRSSPACARSWRDRAGRGAVTCRPARTSASAAGCRKHPVPVHAHRRQPDELLRVGAQASDQDGQQLPHAAPTSPPTSRTRHRRPR